MRGIDKLELQLKDSIRWKTLKTRVKNVYGIEKEELLQDIYYIGCYSIDFIDGTLYGTVNFIRSIDFDVHSRYSSYFLEKGIDKKNYIKELLDFVYCEMGVFVSSEEDITNYRKIFENAWKMYSKPRIYDAMEFNPHIRGFTRR